MKQSVTMLVFLMILCTGYSQPVSTTKKDSCICITATEMRNAIRADDSLQVSKNIIKSQDKVVGEMTDGLKKCDSVLRRQEILHVTDSLRIKNADDQGSNLGKQGELKDGKIADLTFQLKKQKGKLRKVVVLSVAIIGGLSYLLFTK